MRIFINYSRQDKEFAFYLATDLRRLGADIWIDVEDIPSGVNWSSAIQEGLDSTDVMITIISTDSMTSSNVEAEWQYFLDQQKPIIPILLQPTHVHFQLSRIQYIDFKSQSYDKAFGQLIRELQHHGLPFDFHDELLPSSSVPELGEQERSAEKTEDFTESHIPAIGAPRPLRPPIPVSRYGLRILLSIVLLTLILSWVRPATNTITISVAPVFIVLVIELLLGSLVINLCYLYNRLHRPRVFISYRRQTSAMIANYISAMLERHYNISVFMDTRRQDGAAQFPSRLLNEIRLNNIFICLVGDDTFESKWVRTEIKEAVKANKPMIPIFQESYSNWLRDLEKEGNNIRDAIHVGEDWNAIKVLLNSDGIQVFDIANRFIEPAIKEIADMIRNTVASQRG